MQFTKSQKQPNFCNFTFKKKKKNPLIVLSCYLILSYSLICSLYFYIVNTTWQCRAFAKALHYKEMEFEGALSKKMDANPIAVVEALIHINNQLHQHEVYFKKITFYNVYH